MQAISLQLRRITKRRPPPFLWLERIIQTREAKKIVARYQELLSLEKRYMQMQGAMLHATRNDLLDSDKRYIQHIKITFTLLAQAATELIDLSYDLFVRNVFDLLDATAHETKVNTALQELRRIKGSDPVVTQHLQVQLARLGEQHLKRTKKIHLEERNKLQSLYRDMLVLLAQTKTPTEDINMRATQLLMTKPGAAFQAVFRMENVSIVSQLDHIHDLVKKCTQSAAQVKKAARRKDITTQDLDRQIHHLELCLLDFGTALDAYDDIVMRMLKRVTKILYLTSHELVDLAQRQQYIYNQTKNEAIQPLIQALASVHRVLQGKAQALQQALNYTNQELKSV